VYYILLLTVGYIAVGDIEPTYLPDHGRLQFIWERVTPLLWFGLWVALLNMTISGIPNRLNYFVIFALYSWSTNVAASHIIQGPAEKPDDI
jgi:hypothetical protein